MSNSRQGILSLIIGLILKQTVQRLTTALSSENERWGENVSVLRHDAKLLTGDVLLASAFISYMGPFTKPFRSHLMDEVFTPFLINGFQKSCNDDGLSTRDSG